MAKPASSAPSDPGQVVGSPPRRSDPAAQEVVLLASRRLSRAGLADPHRVASLTARLDATDILILALESRSPGPHHEAAGLAATEYAGRIDRMLYDADANAYAGEALARLRAERCH